MAEQDMGIYWYNAVHNVIICNVCHYAVPARMKDRHLRDRHQLKNANQRKATIAAAIPCNVNPLENHTDFPVPPTGPLPVRGLEEVKVWHCRICNYICASSRYAREVHHQRSHKEMAHDLEQAKGQRWFYSGIQSEYWLVQPPVLDGSTMVRQYTGTDLGLMQNLPLAKHPLILQQLPQEATNTRAATDTLSARIMWINLERACVPNAGNGISTDGDGDHGVIIANSTIDTRRGSTSI